ncbi:hypothetical protein L917_09364 [Phytophthora nicotianae]|uniref:Uncharacterized protein n=1 Tax=Phytophthora nicotianae TaxID=4792 RepID=W2L4B8_PHYNI|nr:hypothetical protein L917_09364 [Phytophthora nicotianae]
MRGDNGQACNTFSAFTSARNSTSVSIPWIPSYMGYLKPTTIDNNTVLEFDTWRLLGCPHGANFPAGFNHPVQFNLFDVVQPILAGTSQYGGGGQDISPQRTDNFHAAASVVSSLTSLAATAHLFSFIRSQHCHSSKSGCNPIQPFFEWGGGAGGIRVTFFQMCAGVSSL